LPRLSPHREIRRTVARVVETVWTEALHQQGALASTLEVLHSVTRQDLVEEAQVVRQRSGESAIRRGAEYELPTGVAFFAQERDEFLIEWQPGYVESCATRALSLQVRATAQQPDGNGQQVEGALAQDTEQRF
jgi:hypothetical protein